MKQFQKVLASVLTICVILMGMQLVMAEGKSGLSLESIEVIGKSSFELTFGSDIDNTKEKDFVVKSLPLGDEIEVTEISVTSNKVELSVESEFISDKQYEVVIISLYGLDGSTIISGIDGAIEFNAPDMTQFDIIDTVDPVLTTEKEIKNTQEVVSKIETPIEENPEIELNSAGENNETNVNKNQTNSGTTNVDNSDAENLGGRSVNKDQLDKNIELTAEKADNLPKTGPEHIVFIFLSVIIGGLILFLRRKKA